MKLKAGADDDIAALYWQEELRACIPMGERIVGLRRQPAELVKDLTSS